MRQNLHDGDWVPALKALSVRWHLRQGPQGEPLALSCLLKFASFSQAFAFMTQVAMLAERLDHHPDWSNSYATVKIELTTHDAGGLTPKDVELAQAIDEVIAQQGLSA